MAGVKIMTSDDIYFELDGKKIAGVESYSTRYTNDVKMVDAFGQSTPIGYTIGGKKYTIDISKVYLEDTAIKDGIDFYSLTSQAFKFVIVKGSNKVIYDDCIISDISEDGSLKDKVAEKITLMALKRSTDTVKA